MCFTSQKGKRMILKINTLAKWNLLDKADQAATKQSTGHCQRRNQWSTSSPAITVLNHLQIRKSNWYPSHGKQLYVMLLERFFTLRVAVKHLHCALFLRGTSRTVLMGDERGPQVAERSSCSLYNCCRTTPHGEIPLILIALSHGLTLRSLLKWKRLVCYACTTDVWLTLRVLL